MVRKFLCWFGFHRWTKIGTWTPAGHPSHYFKCIDCQRAKASEEPEINFNDPWHGRGL